MKTKTDLRFVKPTCPACGEEKEGTFVYDETFDNLICQSCRERAAASSPTEMKPSPLRSARSGQPTVDRAHVSDIASQSAISGYLAGARSALFPRRIP